MLQIELISSYKVPVFYLQRCATNTNLTTITLDIVQMDMVSTCRKLMVRSLHAYLVSPIGLTSRFIPSQIILTIYLRPGWYLHYTNTFWTIYITDNDIECASVFIVINYWNGANWLIMFHIYNRFGDIMMFICIINDINISTVIT